MERNEKVTPLITQDFARKLEIVITKRSELSFQLAKNDLDSHVAHFANTTAFLLAKLSHLPWYNRVVGLSEDNLSYLEDILELYKSYSVPCRFEIWPCNFTAKLAYTLAKCGYYPSNQTVILYRLPTKQTELHSATLEISKASSETEKTLAFEVMKQGYGFDEEQSRMLAFELQVQHQDLYIALVNGEPAAAAALFISDNLAYLAGAATLPKFRSRGCQTALIQYRLQQAQNCDAVVVTTAYASPSQHNLERMGFRVLHTKQTWTQL